jgi:hypothetical protein
MRDSWVKLTTFNTVTGAAVRLFQGQCSRCKISLSLSLSLSLCVCVLVCSCARARRCTQSRQMHAPVHFIALHIQVSGQTLWEPRFSWQDGACAFSRRTVFCMRMPCIIHTRVASSRALEYALFSPFPAVPPNLTVALLTKSAGHVMLMFPAG